MIGVLDASFTAARGLVRNRIDQCNERGIPCTLTLARGSAELNRQLLALLSSYSSVRT